MGVDILPAADPNAVARAARLLEDGAIVALPTETVYGLAADAANGEAVARIFAAKDRPAFNPLIVHVLDLAMAERIARFDDRARRLARAFWPGPLTLVLPLIPGAVHPLVVAGQDSVALRAPDSVAARAVIERLGRPVAAPSANRSGALSPTTAQAARDELADRIPLILDGGRCPVGVESTILSLVGERPILLRPGGVALEALDAALGASIEADDGSDDRPLAPGRLASHYAPRARLRLGAASADPGEAWLGFGPQGGPREGPLARNLSPAGDLVVAAANLFADLRALDAALGGQGVIAAAPIPESGLGRAVNDRLRRAAAPRD